MTYLFHPIGCWGYKYVCFATMVAKQVKKPWPDLVTKHAYLQSPAAHVPTNHLHIKTIFFIGSKSPVSWLHLEPLFTIDKLLESAIVLPKCRLKSLDFPQVVSINNVLLRMNPSLLIFISLNLKMPYSSFWLWERIGEGRRGYAVKTNSIQSSN